MCALTHPKWREAMVEEMNALERNHMWENILPEEKNPVGCKWVFTSKYNPNGTINRYKARLVAKGFTQSYGPWG